MKCNACGAIGSAGKSKCEFCGAAMSSGSSTVDVANQVAGPQISFAKDSLNLITELNSTAASGFKIWAFLFPIAYLFGYGANENGKKLLTVILLPVLAMSILWYLSPRLASALDAVTTLWVLFVSYLVATRTHALVKMGGQFSMGAGVAYQIGFILLYYYILML